MGWLPWNASTQWRKRSIFTFKCVFFQILISFKSSQRPWTYTLKFWNKKNQMDRDPVVINGKMLVMINSIPLLEKYVVYVAGGFINFQTIDVNCKKCNAKQKKIYIVSRYFFICYNHPIICYFNNFLYDLVSVAFMVAHCFIC